MIRIGGPNRSENIGRGVPQIPEVLNPGDKDNYPKKPCPDTDIVEISKEGKKAREQLNSKKSK